MTSTHYLQREPFFQNTVFTQGNMNASPLFSFNGCMTTYTHVYINTPYDTHAYINTPTHIYAHIVRLDETLHSNPWKTLVLFVGQNP